MSASREQRLLLKLRWLREERTASLEERQKYIYDIHRAINYVRSRVPQQPVVIPQQAPIAQEERQETSDTEDLISAESNELEQKKVDPDLKRLFREITKKTHPDAVHHDTSISDAQKDHLTSLFMKARIAFEKQDAQSLFEIALDLDIDIEKTSSDILVILEAATKVIEDELESIKESIAWSWGNAHGNHAVRISILEYACKTTNVGANIDQSILVEAIKFCEGEITFEATDRFGRKINVVARPQQFAGRPKGNPVKEMLQRKTSNK